MAPTLTGLAIVLAVAVAAPLVLSLVPWLPIPSVVVEIALGIVIGPHVLGLIGTMDDVTTVLALLGVTFLLFFAGVELDLRGIVNRRFVRIIAAYAASLALAAAIGVGLHAVGVDAPPAFLAIALSATGLGVLLPIMKDEGLLDTEYGQVVFGACAVAEVVPLILLAIAYPTMANGVGEQLARVALLVGVAGLVGIAVLIAQRRPAVIRRLDRLSDTSAQLRVRLTLLILIGLAALATQLGIEVIVGAFAAGLVIGADRDALEANAAHVRKLEGVGFGLLVPVFFVATGIRLDVGAVLGDPGALGLVVVLLLALLAIRGLPVLLYGPLMTARERAGAAFLQATSLSFLIASAVVGLELHVVGTASATALVMAGMGSVLLFPLAARRILRRTDLTLVDALDTPAGTQQPL